MAPYVSKNISYNFLNLCLVSWTRFGYTRFRNFYFRKYYWMYCWIFHFRYFDQKDFCFVSCFGYNLVKIIFTVRSSVKKSVSFDANLFSRLKIPHFFIYYLETCWSLVSDLSLSFESLSKSNRYFYQTPFSLFR